jgi:hypothetical protein
VGHLAYLVRFEPRAEARESLQRWLLQEVLPALPAQRGVGSAHFLQGAATAPMTNEQRIRGADAGVDAALLVLGYEAAVLEELARAVLGPPHLERRGAGQSPTACTGSTTCWSMPKSRPSTTSLE